MNASEAREMLHESQKQPHLTTMVVPSPITFPYDAKVKSILHSGVLGTLIYIEVPSHPQLLPILLGFNCQSGTLVNGVWDQTISPSNLGDSGGAWHGENWLQVKSVGGLGGPAFPELNGSPLTWRQDVDLSGLNIMTLGIYYEALQRRVSLPLYRQKFGPLTSCTWPHFQN